MKNRIIALILCFQFLLAGFALADEITEVSSLENPVVLAASGSGDADWDDFASEYDKTTSGATDIKVEKLISDPLEPMNRGFFWVNDKLYFYLFKPVAKGFRLILPRPVRSSVKNFFFNLATPVRAGNSLLQLNFRGFGTELYRFVINSTFGIGGLFDVAESYAGVKPVVEDFGQTLGFFGAGHGFYLVLPIVGPSSLRDVTGNFVDSFADPFRYTNLETLEYVGVKLTDVENRLSLDPDTYEGILRDSLDPYLFMRAAYAQRRLAQVGKNAYNMNIFQGPLFDSDLLNPMDWFGVE